MKRTVVLLKSLLKNRIDNLY